MVKNGSLLLRIISIFFSAVQTNFADVARIPQKFIEEVKFRHALVCELRMEPKRCADSTTFQG